jgi:hypothetical protein
MSLEPLDGAEVVIVAVGCLKARSVDWRVVCLKIELSKEIDGLDMNGNGVDIPFILPKHLHL